MIEQGIEDRVDDRIVERLAEDRSAEDLNNSTLGLAALVGSPGLDMQANSNSVTAVAAKLAVDRREQINNFLNFFFTVDPSLPAPTIHRHCVYALYLNKVPQHEQYLITNYRQNICHVLYTFIYSRFTEAQVEAFLLQEDANPAKAIAKPERKKTKKDKKSDEGQSTQERFISVLRASKLIPFLRLIPVEQLDLNNEFARTHPNFMYTQDELHQWIEVLSRSERSLIMETPTSERREKKKSSGNGVRRALGKEIPVDILEDETRIVLIVCAPCHTKDQFTVMVRDIEVEIKVSLSIPYYTLEEDNTYIDLTKMKVVSNENICDTFTRVISLNCLINTGSFTVNHQDGMYVVVLKKMPRTENVRTF